MEWRALLEGPPSLLDAGARMDVEFSQGPATAAGATSGAAGPRERAYDVANTDFLADLNRYVPGTAGDFTKLDPARIASGRQSLDGYGSIVLADEPFPGGGDEAGASGSDPEYGRAAMGEIPEGTGRVRFLGALLPQPSEAFDHDFGIEPYAVTYTGWILFCNLLGAECRPQATTAGATACAATAGFSKAKATPRGRKVRMAFTRRLGRRVNVDVFQVSHGRRVLKERLVARFKNRRKGFTWKGRRGTDGTYFVRFRTRYGRLVDTRRTVLRRSKGRFTRRPQFHRRSTCGTLESFNLERAVFGGTQSVPLRIAYRLKRRARVTMRVLRGGKVVRSFQARSTRGGKTVRLRHPARKARRGDHKVRITVVRGSRRTVATLTSRRL